VKPLKPEEKKFIGYSAVVTILIVAASIGTPWFGIMAKVQEFKKVRVVLAEKRMQLEDANQKKNSIGDLEQDIEEAEAEIAEVEQRLPNTKQAPELFQELDRLAELAQQDYKTMKASELKEESTYTEIPFEIELKANYHDLGLYINMIERSKRFAKVDALDIEYDHEMPLSQTVNVTVSTFKFKSKDRFSSGDGSTAGDSPRS
jgi:Tfp pilus assembly protein PilO